MTLGAVPVLPFILGCFCPGPTDDTRGCPVDILRAEHDGHVSIQTDRSRRCARELPGEFSVWKAGRDADDAVELL